MSPTPRPNRRIVHWAGRKPMKRCAALGSLGIIETSRENNQHYFHRARSVSKNGDFFMKLVIAHYHLRPGGVRRVIELATPHIVRAFGDAITAVTLASGEAPDPKWHRVFQQSVAAAAELFVEPAFGYFSEQQLAPTALRCRIRQA